MRGKRFAALGLLLVLTISLLTGCATKTRPLPKTMEEEVVGEAARKIVTMLVNEDYQGVADAFRQDMKETYSVDADAVKAIVGDIKTEAGAFVEFNKTVAVGGKSKGFDEEYASVVVAAKHENKTVFYEISLDQDLHLLGLGLKQSKR